MMSKTLKIISNFLTKSDLKNYINLIENCDKKKLINQIKISYLHNQFLEFVNDAQVEKKFDKKILNRLAYESKLLASRNLEIIKTGIQIADILNQNNIEYVYLKGFGLVIDKYKNIADRTLRDIDILINVEDIDIVLKKLNEKGFYFRGRSNKENIEYLIDSDHYDLPCLVNEQGIIVELHYKIINKYPHDKCLLSNSIFKNKKKINVYNTEVYVTQDEENFVHILFHATSKEYFSSGLYFFSDLNRLEISNGLDYKKIILLIKKLNLIKELSIYFQLLKENEIKSKFLEKDYPNIEIPKDLINDVSYLLVNQLGVSRKRLRNFNNLSNKKFTKKIRQLFILIFPSKDKIYREFGEKISFSNFLVVYFKRLQRIYYEFMPSVKNYMLQKNLKSLKKDNKIYSNLDRFFN